MNKFLAGLALSLGLGAGAASATTYDFTGGNMPSSGGIGYGCMVGGSDPYTCAVTFNDAGLGISSPGDEDPGMIDSDGGMESLIISFNGFVTVRTLVIGLLNWVDDFTVETRQGTLVFGPRTPSRTLTLDLYTDYIAISALPDPGGACARRGSCGSGAWGPAVRARRAARRS